MSEQILDDDAKETVWPTDDGIDVKKELEDVSNLTAKLLSALEDHLAENPNGRIRLLVSELLENKHIKNAFENVEQEAINQIQEDLPGTQVSRTPVQLRATELVEAMCQKSICEEKVKDRKSRLRTAMESDNVSEVVFQDQFGEKHKFILDQEVKVKKVSAKENE